MSKCQYRLCEAPLYARNLCRNHYRQRVGESATRWQLIKSDPVMYEHNRLNRRKWEQSHTRDYRKHSDLIYFGGLREITIQRDREKCVECGMTREAHLARWGKDLHVNHIDHTKVNLSENLETLCIRCHASKSHESIRTKRTTLPGNE